jgi:ATP-GRASP peptide maturase of grasp-with-spasm system
MAPFLVISPVGPSMICILSKAHLELTTESVMDWLSFWRVPAIRMNVEDLTAASLSVFIDRSGVNLSWPAGKIRFDPTRIKVVWYRRWGSYLHTALNGQVLFGDAAQENWQDNTINSALHLQRELRTVSEFVFHLLSSARWLSDPNTGIVNKLRVLKLAAECELDIPATSVSNDRASLSAFIEKYGRVVTKAVGEALICEFKGTSFVTYTSLVEQDTVNDRQSSRVFPTLLQECLNKQYEVRVFYLDGLLYSMAIFSQSNEQTAVDFRRYQFQRPNRTVPYQLPGDISSKLTMLLQRLGLETASIDLVKTVDGRHVFLEVNPMGQFGMVSFPCNYHLERAVAAALVKRLYHE